MTAPHHRPRILTKPCTILTLLQDTLTNLPPSSSPQSHETTLLFCTTRQTFLSTLKAQILAWVPPREEIPPSQESDVELDLRVDPDDDDERRAKHAFSVPSLHLLGLSQQVKVVFCPSIAGLRAWVATFSPGGAQTGTDTHAAHADPPTGQQHRLIIVDLLALHDGTSEFTVQGLSRSFAAVAATAYRAGLRVELVECECERGFGLGVDGEEMDGGTGSGNVLWDAEVPLLSKSVRIAGNAGAWVGRTVCVRRVVKRWFEIVD